MCVLSNKSRLHSLCILMYVLGFIVLILLMLQFLPANIHQIPYVLYILPVLYQHRSTISKRSGDRTHTQANSNDASNCSYGPLLITCSINEVTISYLGLGNISHISKYTVKPIFGTIQTLYIILYIFFF